MARIDHPPPLSLHRWAALTTLVGGAVLPALVAVAWIPLRRSLPNTDVALMLVATIPLVAFLGGRPATVLGSVSAAVSFDYLHSAPFGHWQIARTRDVVTTLLVVLVGLFVGELTVRVSHHRAVADRGSRDLAVLAETAELMAVGDDPVLVLAAVAGELQRVLALRDCQFSAGPPPGGCPRVERDGSLTGPAGAAAGAEGGLDLPVWVQGTVLGHYHLVFDNRSAPAPDRLAFAVSLSDQAGAALALVPPLPPWHPSEPRLRLVGPAEGPAGPRVGSARNGGGEPRAQRDPAPPLGARAG